MSFDFFRRQQKTILAGLAILAMFLFTIDQSVYYLFNNKTAGPPKAELKLFGKQYYADDLLREKQERLLANNFVSAFLQLKISAPVQNLFGEAKDRDAVDAIILKKKADELGIPLTTEMGKDFLRNLDGILVKQYGLYTGLPVEMIREQFKTARANLDSNAEINYLAQAKKMVAPELDDNAVLLAVANQYRVYLVRDQVGQAQYTPLDVFEGFRDRHEQVSADAVGFPVEDHVKEVKTTSSDADLKALFEKHKAELSNPNSPTPGFKIPRKVRVMHASIDAKALTDKTKSDILANGKELPAYFESRKKALIEETEAAIRAAIADGRKPDELPINVFEKGEVETSLSLMGPVEARLLDQLATQKVEDQISQTLTAIDDKVMVPFLRGYDNAEKKYVDQEDARRKDQPEQTKGAGDEFKPIEADDLWAFGLEDTLKQMATANGIVPNSSKKTGDRLAQILEKVVKDHPGVVFGLNGPFEQAKMKDLGDLELARSGKSFTESLIRSSETFEQMLFGGVDMFGRYEIADSKDRRYIVWRIEDQDERLATFEEAKPQVEAAWKFAEARKLAEAKAKEFAKQIQDKKGDLKTLALAAKMTVKELPMTTKFQGSAGQELRASLSAIDEKTGNKLRDAVFKLTKPEEPEVAPNGPETVYYVVAFRGRIFSTVTDMAGIAHERDVDSARNVLKLTSLQARYGGWVAELRKQAGVPEDWKPSDEKTVASAAR